MQRGFYVSCMKINGVPLLPPLMTDSIKEEMKHYRSLAVKVEETLKARLSVKCTVEDKSMQADVIKSVNKANDAKYCSDSDLSSYNTRSDTDNSDSRSKITVVDHVSTIQIAGEAKDEHDQSSISSIQYSEVESNLTNDIVNDMGSVTARPDQGESVNETEVRTSSEDTISLENSKLEVPRTLNIVPITLSNFEHEEDSARSLTLSKESEDLPKLSRQGSYVLDTPSPMLLAHMSTELADKNYVPTSTTINVLQQKKQWNIIQPKVEWENKHLVAEDIKASNKLESMTQKSNFQHTETDILTEPYQMNKSIDPAGTTNSKEHTQSKSDLTPTEYSHTSNTEFKNTNLLERSKRDDSSYTLNAANGLQEYVEDVSSPETQAFGANGSKPCDKIEITKDYQDLFIKAKSSITSDKLLMVYKKIEEIHKKQMMELVDRQQREQLLLQAEFQRQQMLLLGEIQRCSSRIPYQVNPSNVTADQLASCDESRIEDTINEGRQQLDMDSFGDSHTRVYCNNKLPSADYANVIVCPLDNISPTKLHLLKGYKSPLFTRNNSIAFNEFVTKRINLRDAIYNNGDNDSNNNNNNNNNNGDDDDSNNCVLHDRTRRKNSNVNRQLFPLASNTIHVPVLDTSIYHDKHVRAVNIINAYTRGYLARRLMRTERVITLKKIYKEALQCMLKLHVDAPLNLAEVNFLHRLQLQCDAASMNLVELFAQSPARRMKVIAQDREIRQSRTERPTSARSYSFATQKTLARKNLREFESTTTKYQRPSVKKNTVRSRCQTWTSDITERLVSPNTLNQSIRRSTSTGTVRKPWR